MDGKAKQNLKLYKQLKESKSTEFVSMKNSKGEMLYDIYGIVDALKLKDSFKELLEGEDIGQENCDIEQNVFENPIERVCVTEFRDIIKNLKSGKATKLCIETGEVPDNWREAIIVPIYKKKGDKSNCSNYRGISLLSTVSKIYSKIFIRRVMEITEKKIWEVQSGFMPGRSCTDQIEGYTTPEIGVQNSLESLYFHLAISAITCRFHSAIMQSVYTEFRNHVPLGSNI